MTTAMTPPGASLPPTSPDGAPPGWALHTRRSPLTRPWEPLYTQDMAALGERGPAVALAIRVAEPHCNGRGFAHGGLISALADNAMGLSAVSAARAARATGATGAEGAPQHAGAVTVSLVLDFMASAGVGQWLEFRPVVLRHGRTLAFTECHVMADGLLVARASATFRLG
jgi:acyl-coenzyme A thioesterase PaaI-like protein